VATGERERALEVINLSVDRHVPSMVWVKVSPELAEVRSDRRFTGAVAKMTAE